MFYCTVHKQKGRHVSSVSCDYSEKACNGSKSRECAEKYGGKEGADRGRRGQKWKEREESWCRVEVKDGKR